MNNSSGNSIIKNKKKNNVQPNLPSSPHSQAHPSVPNTTEIPPLILHSRLFTAQNPKYSPQFQLANHRTLSYFPAKTDIFPESSDHFLAINHQAPPPNKLKQPSSTPRLSCKTRLQYYDIRKMLRGFTSPIQRNE